MVWIWKIIFSLCHCFHIIAIIITIIIGVNNLSYSALSSSHRSSIISLQFLPCLGVGAKVNVIIFPNGFQRIIMTSSMVIHHHNHRDLLASGDHDDIPAIVQMVQGVPCVAADAMNIPGMIIMIMINIPDMILVMELVMG